MCISAPCALASSLTLVNTSLPPRPSGDIYLGVILKITALRSRARIALLAIFHHSFPAPSCGSESRARTTGTNGALLGTNIAHFRSLRLLAQHVLREPTKQSMTDSHLSCRLYSTFSPLCLRTNETAARNNPLPPARVKFPSIIWPTRKSEKRQCFKDTIPIPSRSEISDNRQVDPCQ